MSRVIMISICNLILLLSVFLQTSYAQQLTKAQSVSELSKRIQLSSSFVSTFIQSLEDSDTLRNIFSLAIPEFQNKDLTYELFYKAAEEFQNPDPSVFSKAFVDALLSARDVLTPEKWAKVIAMTVGRALNDNGVLTSSSASELAKKYASSIEKEGLSVGTNPQPGAYNRILMEGTLQFIKEEQVISPQTAVDMVTYSIEEFYAVKIFS